MNLITKSSKFLLRSSVNYENVAYPTFIRYASTDWREEVDITSVDETPKYIDELTEEKKAEVLRKRNKSGLQYYDYNRVHGRRPHEEIFEWYHETIKYRRKLLGRYGVQAMNMPVGALWFKKETIDDQVEYEKAAYPHSLEECFKMLAEKKQEETERIQKRDKEIEENLKKVATWEAELRKKVAKKEELLLAAQERKKRLIEEVRRQIGYEIDPRDDRFKEVLEQKEKEDKKRKKEVKKQERSAKIMAQLLEQSQAVSKDISKKAEKTSNDSPKSE